MIQLTIYRSSLQLEDVLGSCFFFFFDWAVLIVMSKGAFWMTVFPNKMRSKKSQLVWGLVRTSQLSFFVCHLKNSGQIITTSADVTLNGGLIRELPQNCKFLTPSSTVQLFHRRKMSSMSKWLRHAMLLATRPRCRKGGGDRYLDVPLEVNGSMVRINRL